MWQEEETTVLCWHFRSALSWSSTPWDFFTKLNEEDISYNKNLEILMTHPHNDSRIAKVTDYRAARDFKEKALDLDWKAAKAAVRERSRS